MLDEIQDPGEPTAIILKYLDDNLLTASNKEKLSRAEVKYVARMVLEALNVLHVDGYVHTDVKPNNVFVNYGERSSRFTDVELGDFGSTYHEDSEYAKGGAPIGAPIWRSPEALFEMPWTTATDIWSFGTMLIHLSYGDDFDLFKPRDVPFGHEEYELKILMRQFQFFGPFPGKFEDIADSDTVTTILWIMEQIPSSALTQFHRISEKELAREDKEFICKIMHLDPRDRHSAKELLKDEWFEQDAAD